MTKFHWKPSQNVFLGRSLSTQGLIQKKLINYKQQFHKDQYRAYTGL